MLYVSRKISRERYEIIDTDDNVPETISYEDLRELYETKDLGIMGVKYERYKNGKLKSLTVNVYTPPSNDIRTTKLKVLKGIELSVVDGVLYSINYTSDIKATIRLSDYCTSLSNYIYQGRHFSGARNNDMIVILDDNITDIASKAFKDWDWYNSKLDIRELTNPKLVDIIYSTWISDVYSLNEGSKPIIDDDLDRYYKWVAIYYFDKRMIIDRSQNVTIATNLIHYYKDFINKKYKRELLSVCNAKFDIRIKRYSQISNISKSFYSIMNNREIYTISELILKQSNYERLIRLLIRCSSINANVLSRLFNYLYCMDKDADKDILEAFIRFSRRFVDELPRLEKDFYAATNK